MTISATSEPSALSRVEVNRPSSVNPDRNPFDGELALANSRYFGTKGGRAVLISDPAPPRPVRLGGHRGVPGVRARPAVLLRRGEERRSTRPSGWASTRARPRRGHGRPRPATCSRSPASRPATEATTSDLRRHLPGADRPGRGRVRGAPLGQLAAPRLDAPLHDWDPAVSPDPDDPHFGFSFAGTAFFVVGLHPESSRLARRFPWPTLVFNPHAQFEPLKEAGRWDRIQDVIRDREKTLQGPSTRTWPTTARRPRPGSIPAGRGPDWDPPFAAGPPSPSARPLPVRTPAAREAPADPAPRRPPPRSPDRDRVLPRQGGAAAGDRPTGEQVSDLVAFARRRHAGVALVRPDRSTTPTPST